MGDTSKHLTYFKVENFKRFESFEMKDLGQFNLIVGDNNVGKTSVLEALLMDESETILINNLSKALALRRIKNTFKIKDIEFYANKSQLLHDQNLNISIVWQYKWGTDLTHLSITIDQLRQSVVIKSHGSLRAHARGNRETYAFSDQMNQYSSVLFNFIPFYQGHDSDLLSFYKTLQKSNSLKEKFIKSLKIIIPQIKNIEPSTDEDIPGLIIYQNDIDATIPLALFGDGALKVFRLLAEIIVNKNGRLMIDEIDTGIHYSRFKEFWRVILKAAKENDVQLFMTTHNEECIKYFVEVLAEDDMRDFQNDAKSISLIELPNKSVEAFTYSFEQLEANVHLGNEVRGGGR